MKRYIWKWAASLVLGALASDASAQGRATVVYPSRGGYISPSGPGCCAPSTALPPGYVPKAGEALPPDTPGQPIDDRSGTGMQAGQGGGDNYFSGLGGTQSGYLQGNVAAGGAGLASVTNVAGNVGPDGQPAMVPDVPVNSPLILPGLFTAINPQSPLPMNRIFFSYGYYDGFRVRGRTGATQSGFNLHRYDAGFELAVLDGRASIYGRIPVLDATQNRTGQAIDGLGDVSAGVKLLLLSNPDTGSAISTGLTVAAPTARDAVVTTAIRRQFPAGNDIGVGIPTDIPTTTTINPWFYQPWVGGIFVRDRFFIQEYFGVVIPDDSRISTLINNDITAGYTLYQSDDPCSRLTSITPTVGVQVLIPVSNRDGGAGSFGFSDQVFLTGGITFGLGERTTFSTAVTTPVAGPRAYDYGITFGLNIGF